MAINKKLIHFNTFENFNSMKLSANAENTQYTLGTEGTVQTGSPDILYQSIVYIKDTQQQWTHGQLYAGGGSSDSSTIPVVNHSESSGSFELTPNTLHIWDTVTSLTLTLQTPEQEDVYNEYMVQFTSGSTATTLALPDSIKFLNDITIEANKIYQISIVNNLAIIGGFNNE